MGLINNSVRGFRFGQVDWYGNIYGGLSLPAVFRISGVDPSYTTSRFYVDALNGIGKSTAELADALTNGVSVKVLNAATTVIEGTGREISAVSVAGNRFKISVSPVFSGALTAGDVILLAPTELLTGNVITLHKGGTKTPTMAGVNLTEASDGEVLVAGVALQKGTDESNNVTSLVIYTDDTVPLNHTLKGWDGSTVAQAALLNGARFYNPVGWKLSTGKILKVKSVGADGTGNYYWTIYCVGLTPAAKIASA